MIYLYTISTGQARMLELLLQGFWLLCGKRSPQRLWAGEICNLLYMYIYIWQLLFVLLAIEQDLRPTAPEHVQEFLNAMAQPKSGGLQPTSNGLRPTGNGLQPANLL